MKKIIKIFSLIWLALFLTACFELSESDIAETVKESMQDEFNSSSDFSKYGLRVTDVKVIKKNKNSYKGISSIIYKGSSHNVGIDIVVDGDYVMWEAPPGSFFFITQQELLNLFR